MATLGNAIEYEIVHSYNRHVLVDFVNDRIEEGWQPIGGVQVDTRTIEEFTSFYQAMVKPE